MSSEDSDRFGVASMSSRLERVAVRKPSAILRADAAEWHYRKRLDPERLLSEFSSFIALLDRSGVEILWFDDEPDDLADSIFAYSFRKQNWQSCFYSWDTIWDPFK